MNSIRQRAASGIVWSAVGTWGNQLASFAVFIALTRLLDPEAFGLVAMASVFTAFVNVFAEQGFGKAIVQRAQLDPEHLDTAFWTNLLVGLALTTVGMLISGAIATLYEEPDLQPVVAALSATFVLTALGSTQQALLQRTLSFRALSIRRLLSALVGGIAGIAIAFYGGGVFALVARTLVSGLIGVFLLWGASKWRPRLQYSRKHLEDLAGFGMNMVGVNITNFLRTRLDDFLIGLFLGAEALGYYTVAYRLGRLFLDMVSGVMGSVAVSLFARLQHDFVQLRKAFYKLIRLAALVAFPLLSGLILLAPELIITLSGEQWRPSIPVMRVLSLAAFPLTLQYFGDFLLVAIGKPDLLLRINIVSTIVYAIAVAVGTQFGLIYVASAYLTVNTLFLAVYLMVVDVQIQLQWRRYFAQLWLPILGCIVMATILLGVRQLAFDGPSRTILELVLLCLLGGAAYLSVLLFDRRVLVEVLEFARAAMRKKNALNN